MVVLYDDVQMHYVTVVFKGGIQNRINWNSEERVKKKSNKIVKTWWKLV